jgi:hypothetical protein
MTSSNTFLGVAPLVLQSRWPRTAIRADLRLAREQTDRPSRSPEGAGHSDALPPDHASSPGFEQSPMASVAIPPASREASNFRRAQTLALYLPSSACHEGFEHSPITSTSNLEFHPVVAALDRRRSACFCHSSPAGSTVLSVCSPVSMEALRAGGHYHRLVRHGQSVRPVQPPSAEIAAPVT